ncbi:MAG: hypothetical protein HXY22_04590 [Alphaproteobacteria bacterium]|nr:hypothetical protein [Alphaproteobacteria bacterium]
MNDIANGIFRAEVRRVVYDELRAYTANSCDISDDKFVVDDLNLASDNQSDLIMKLESRFKFKSGIYIWGNVYTVGDIIRVCCTFGTCNYSVL